LSIKSSKTNICFVDVAESNSLLAEEPTTEEEQHYTAKEFKYYEDIVNHRNNKLERFREHAFYIGKISKDINSMTQEQHNKIERIDDNLGDVLYNAKETFNSLLKTSKEESNFRNNKCCVILLISLALFFLILIMLNMNR
jgi:t-SNARE complex subunit (syntaxin)